MWSCNNFLVDHRHGTLGKAMCLWIIYGGWRWVFHGSCSACCSAPRGAALCGAQLAGPRGHGRATSGPAHTVPRSVSGERSPTPVGNTFAQLRPLPTRPENPVLLAAEPCCVFLENFEGGLQGPVPWTAESFASVWCTCLPLGKSPSLPGKNELQSKALLTSVTFPSLPLGALQRRGFPGRRYQGLCSLGPTLPSSLLPTPELYRGQRQA